MLFTFLFICFTGGSRFVACLSALGPPANLAVYFYLSASQQAMSACWVAELAVRLVLEK